MKKIYFISITLLTFILSHSQVTVSTLAGSTSGFLDGTGNTAKFQIPGGITNDAAGNIYVGDVGNNKIRKVTPAGVVTTFAGSTAGFINGTGTNAKFNNPNYITIDMNGNLFVADVANYCIRKITPMGVVTTIAGSGFPGYVDGSGSSPRFQIITGIAVDNQGVIYVTERVGRIRKITPSGTVTTFASNPTAGFSAELLGLAIDFNGNLYVADSFNFSIKKITPTGTVTTFAGTGIDGFANGAGTIAQFSYPTDVATDVLGNVYVSDYGNSRIRKISPSGVVTTLAGSGTLGFADGDSSIAQFNNPQGITVDNGGNIYVADKNNHKIRKISGNLNLEENNKINKIIIYPNPVKDYVIIDFGMYLDITDYKIKITNALGQVVFNKEINSRLDYIQIDSWTGPGIYFVNIMNKDENVIELKKIILQ